MIVFTSLNDPELIHMLQHGAVGIMYTDTIYGIVAQADNPDAVMRLGKLKERGQKPGTVIAANYQQLITLGVDQEKVMKIQHLWPNPLSIELPIGENLKHLYQDGAHRAFRVPDDEALRTLLAQTGPLLTSSANPHGLAPADSIAAAQKYFGERADFYVDGGDRSNRPPSTVAVLHDDNTLEVVRQGAVVIDEHGYVQKD